MVDIDEEVEAATCVSALEKHAGRIIGPCRCISEPGTLRFPCCDTYNSSSSAVSSFGAETGSSLAPFGGMLGY